MGIHILRSRISKAALSAVAWGVVWGLLSLSFASAAPTDLVIVAAKGFPADSLTIEDVQKTFLVAESRQIRPRHEVVHLWIARSTFHMKSIVVIRFSFFLYSLASRAANRLNSRPLSIRIDVCIRCKPASARNWWCRREGRAAVVPVQRRVG